MFNLKKFKLNLKPLGNNVFNNMLSTNPSLLGNTNSKLVNNKEVHKKILYYGNKGNAPPISFVKKIYSKIPDDETVPVVFMTKRQYLQEYIKNQERKNGVVFTKQEKERYLNNELKEMRPIVSRFTTYHNPYMPPRVVYFTDSKLSKQQFQHDAHHEFGHELYERQAKLRQNWNMRVTPRTSPTNYGRTSVDEDFAESYALYKENKLRDGNRAEVFNNIRVDQASKDMASKQDVKNFAEKTKNLSPRNLKYKIYDENKSTYKLRFYPGYGVPKFYYHEDNPMWGEGKIFSSDVAHSDSPIEDTNQLATNIMLDAKKEFNEDVKNQYYKKGSHMDHSSDSINIIIKKDIIEDDNQSQNFEDEGPDEYIWGHRWVEDEYGQPKKISFKIPIRNLGARKSIKMKDVEDIVAAPFLTREEKAQKLEELGATRGIIRMAEMKLSQNRRRRIGGSQWK